MSFLTGPGGGDKKTTNNYDQKIAVTGSGQAVRDSGIIANPNSIVNSGSVSIVSSDPTVTKAALARNGDVLLAALGHENELTKAILLSQGATLEKTLSSVADSSRAQLSQFSGLTSSVLAANTKIAESKLTDGASSVNRNILYIVLGISAAVVLGIFAWRNK